LIVLSVLGILGSWRWGDWKNFDKYYPTLLYVTVGNLIYKVFALNQFHLWLKVDGELFNSEITYFIFLFLVMIPMTFIFLSKFPKTKGKSILYVLGWIFLFIFLEWVGVKYLHSIKHCNGWNIWWSLLFDTVMFPMLRLHFVNYKLALLLSIPCTLFMLIRFNYI
jgi:hypothetical protein